MKKEITNVSVKRATKVGALMGFFFSLLLALVTGANIFLSAYLAGGSLWSPVFFTAAAVPLMPLLGIAYGAAFGASISYCYNFVAARWGGIEVTSHEASRPGARVNPSSGGLPAVTRTKLS